MCWYCTCSKPGMTFTVRDRGVGATHKLLVLSHFSVILVLLPIRRVNTALERLIHTYCNAH